MKREIDKKCVVTLANTRVVKTEFFVKRVWWFVVKIQMKNVNYGPLKVIPMKKMNVSTDQ